MKTKFRVDIFKSKVYMSNLILVYKFMTTELTNLGQAFSNMNWISVMLDEYKALMNNKT